MRFTQAAPGRVFVLRLEDGEVVHEVIERFAAEHRVVAAAVILVGGAQRGSRLVVGPADGDARPVAPVELALEDVHEIAGVGTLFPDESGAPILHMHVAGGRGREAVTGCARSGVKIWQIGEAVVLELLDCAAVRRRVEELGFSVLEPSPPTAKGAPR